MFLQQRMATRWTYPSGSTLTTQRIIHLIRGVTPSIIRSILNILIRPYHQRQHDKRCHQYTWPILPCSEHKLLFSRFIDYNHIQRQQHRHKIDTHSRPWFIVRISRLIPTVFARIRWHIGIRHKVIIKRVIHTNRHTDCNGKNRGNQSPYFSFRENPEQNG